MSGLQQNHNKEDDEKTSCSRCRDKRDGGLYDGCERQRRCQFRCRFRETEGSGISSIPPPPSWGRKQYLPQAAWPKKQLQPASEAKTASIFFASHKGL